MSFCVKCGAKLLEDAAYCPSCGASQKPQQAAVTSTQSHRELSVILVLVGGILGLLFSLLSMAMIPFFAGMMNYEWMMNNLGMMGRYGVYGMMGYPRFGFFLGGVMLLWSVIGFIGAVLAIYSGLKLRQNYGKAPAIVGILGGVLLLITFSWLPGAIVLAGSIIAYAE